MGAPLLICFTRANAGEASLVCRRGNNFVNRVFNRGESEAIAIQKKSIPTQYPMHVLRCARMCAMRVRVMRACALRACVRYVRLRVTHARVCVCARVRVRVRVTFAFGLRMSSMQCGGCPSQCACEHVGRLRARANAESRARMCVYARPRGCWIPFRMPHPHARICIESPTSI